MKYKELFFSYRVIKDKLLDYYKYLYSDVKTETLDACKEDTEHIDEMCEKYVIPGYLDKEKIRSYYRIDRHFASETANRIKQKKMIEEEFMMNPYLSKARESADEHIKCLFDRFFLRMMNGSRKHKRQMN